MNQKTEIGENNLQARARSGVLWLGSTTIIWQVLNWLLTILTARYLLPSDYGLMALADTVLTYLWIVASLGSNAWLLQCRDWSVEVVNQVWTLQVLLGTVVSVIGLAAAPGLAEFYNSPELVSPFRLLVCTFLLHSIWGIEETVRQRELQFRRVAIVNLVVTLVRGFTQLILAMLGYGVWALVVGIVLREVVAIACYAPSMVKRVRFSWHPQITADVLRFGLPLSGSSLLWIVTNTADNIAVGKLFGGGVLGLYAMAFYLTDLPLSKLNTVVRPVLIPFLVRLRDGQQSAIPLDPLEGPSAANTPMKVAFLRASQSLLLVVAPLLVGLFVVSEEAVDILLGTTWKPLTPYLRLMCLVGLLRALVDNVSPMFHALGKPIPQMIHNLISAVVLTTSFIVFGSKWGIVGIFSAWLFVFPILSGLLLVFLNRVSGITPVSFIANLLPPLVGSVVMAIAASLARLCLLNSSEGLRLALTATFGGAAYLLTLFFGYPHVLKHAYGFFKSPMSDEATEPRTGTAKQA